MSKIRLVPLGAGQDVGRSCILMTINGRNIMFDCGMHMGYQNEKRFPDFTYLSRTGDFDLVLDCVIISHFHLDHCGALPYFTEMCGYNGPVLMTYPTKAICPILLEDYRRIAVEKKGDTNMYSSQMIKDCMKKVTALNLKQKYQIDEDFEVIAYYAGHVLGAAMFYVRVKDQSAVYTGDYNMTPDRHLGSAWIDRLYPDVLITETTYGTTIRDSKRSRERDFLKKVHDCVHAGGKVLIPVFALGRAQELCILIDSYWERMNLKVPIYFSAGLTEKANKYYKLFIGWTNEKIKKTFIYRNMFDFKHIKPFDRSLIEAKGPMVLFASPGMLHSGTSLDVFKKWAPDPLNTVIMPGYCVAGTVGARIIAGAKTVEIGKQIIQVNMKVQYLSFSAHADAKGIMQLISQARPKNVVLVHGEKAKMSFLKTKIEQEFQIPCFFPANGQSIELEANNRIPLLLHESLVATGNVNTSNAPKTLREFLDRPSFSEIHGLLSLKEDNRLVLEPNPRPSVGKKINSVIRHTLNLEVENVKDWLDRLMKVLTESNISHSYGEDHNQQIFSISSGSVKFEIKPQTFRRILRYDLEMSWEYADETLASRMIDCMTSLSRENDQ